MPTYRLYKLDQAGKYDTSEGLEAADDSAALVMARAVGHPFTCELWLARRLVGRFMPARY